MAHIDDSNFLSILQNSFNHPVLVDCYLANCGPCKLLEKTLQSILPKYTAAADADSATVGEASSPLPKPNQQQLIACKWDVDTKDNSRQFMQLLRDTKMTFSKLPTLILFVDGMPVAKRSGMATNGQLDQFLEDHLSNHNVNDEDEIEDCVTEINLQGEFVGCQ